MVLNCLQQDVAVHGPEAFPSMCIQMMEGSSAQCIPVLTPGNCFVLCASAHYGLQWNNTYLSLNADSQL